MKHTITSAAIWFFAICLAVAAGITYLNFLPHASVDADALRLDDQEATIRAIQRANPAVVSVTVSETQKPVATPDGKGTIQNLEVSRRNASGFLISADGLILTNRHVVSIAKGNEGEYRVTLYSGKQYYAQLIGTDPMNDLAVLKIYDAKLPFLQMGDSNKLVTGSSVIAIGNALGRYSNSATKGIVSGLGRSLQASDSNGEDEQLQNIIQTDAQINVGNSGGPLIDLSGNVVGINVAKDEGGESIGFAIPINEARPVIESARNLGRIVRSRLGVRYVIITPDIAEQKKLPRTSGAYIMGNGPEELAVAVGSPAALAGIQEGDIIYEVDGRPVDERQPLVSYINQYAPGKRLGLKVQRGDKIFSVIVTLDELNPL